MALFDERREELQRARAQAELARNGAAATRAKFDLLKSRGADEKQLEEARRRAEELQRQVLETRAREIDAIHAFAAVDDPRTAIANFDDRIPILMFPVRIETRFRQDVNPPQLLVRIYPDDCVIDTFDGLLSEDEANAARKYWQAVWAAGRNDAQRQAAWRLLVGMSGAGRAEWIASNVFPQGPFKEPKKDEPTDVILVVVVDAPLAESEAEAVRNFWKSLWLADGAKTEAEAAHAQLVSDVGATRAEELIAATRPFNFDVKPDAPLKKDGVGLQLEYLWLPRFDDLTLKRHAWASPARAALLPDRFVFIGRQSGKADVVQLGEPVLSPLVVSPDPSLPEAEQLRHDPDGKLLFPEDMQWMVDFDRAVKTGMGMSIDLTRELDGSIAGFDRVIVTGLRLSADERTAQFELQSLFTHHRFSRTGLAVIPQGTPTNNTDDAASGQSRNEDASSTSIDWQRPQLWDPAASFDDKPDGQWLADFLGIENATLLRVANSDRRDQGEARALNTALWRSTLGWYFGSLMAPILTANDVEWLHGFFLDFVSGRGAIPALRIGSQPYGILPTTAYSRSGWFFIGDPELDRVATLYSVTKAMLKDWDTYRQDVAYVGKSGNPHQLLLDIVALHAGSVEHTWRIGETDTQLRMRLKAAGVSDPQINAILDGYAQNALNLLKTLGYLGTQLPTIARTFFLRDDVALDGPLVDDRPLSESAPIRPYAANDTDNYLAWLVAASNDHDVLRNQKGFKDPQPPAALLYKFLRRSLLLAFNDTKERGRIAEALKRLIDVPTARLERAFTEHLDCCAYRLDAWMQGIVRKQLARMRTIEEGRDPEKGIYLGAYAWVENLRPDAPLKPAKIPAEVLPDYNDVLPIHTSSENQGYIHAPSLNHAVTAAVLRNGYLSNADETTPDTFAVNLSSERVRVALSMLEGLRGGQSLGALLGYQFERGLHDRYEKFGVEVDAFILPLRREFPLASNRMASTRNDDDALAIDSIEARNVIDGLSLVNYARDVGATYPFAGKPRLKKGSAEQHDAITAETTRLLEIHDAIADLAMSEGVFQAVLGNYDRLGATLDSLSKGLFPPEPQVVRTPIEGSGINHRVGVHLKPGLSAEFSPVSGVAPSPRSLAEPAVNEWIASLLPPFEDVACVVTYRDTDNVERKRQVSLRDLALQPVDVLRLVNQVRDQSGTELDERLTARVATLARPDGPVTIAYMDKGTAKVSLFELLPVVHHLHQLIRGARPLAPTDLARPNDAKNAQDERITVDVTRIEKTRDALKQLRADLNAFLTPIAAWVNDREAHRADFVANCDAWIDALPPLFGRAALFAIPQSGWSFAYELRRNVFASVRAKASEVVERWNRKLIEHDALITQYNNLPSDAPEADKYALLTRAENAVTTNPTTPLPNTPAAYLTAIAAKRAAFAARRTQFAALGDSKRLTIKDLLADFAALLPLRPFDLTDLTADAEIDACFLFAEDLVRVTKVLIEEADRRTKLADAALVQHGAAAMASARVAALTAAAKALLGDEFVIVPEFTIAAEQQQGLADAHGASSSLLDYLRKETDDELPVDTWLYGIARVRERMRDWEQLVLFAGALGNTEPELTPLQLPHAAGDSWLALEFPDTMELKKERLLYTAHFRDSFDPSKRQCGLLLDEWTEVIPAESTTTGVAVHYDRPNNEAPQTMLLLTPTLTTGQWNWRDVVDALSETLDLAKIRAVEPRHLDPTTYPQFLPAAVWEETFQ